MEIGLFLIYIFKVSVYIVIFYLVNKLLLSNETQHRAIRLIWLSSIVLALVLPQFSISPDLFISDTESGDFMAIPSELVVEEHYIDAGSSIKESIVSLSNIVFALFVVYIMGAIALFITKSALYIKLIRFISRCDTVNDSKTNERLNELCMKLKIGRNIELKECKVIDSPLSWINYIVLDCDSESTNNVMIHELAHIKYYHSLDIIFMDILSIFLWFNPAIWLTKRQLQQLHEYQADELVLKMGANIKEYQLLLIKKAVGTQLHSMANSFNHSNLKKRITMMLKTKSSRWAAYKAIYALPLALVVATVYANDSVSESINMVSEVKVNNFQTTIQTDSTTTATQKVAPLVILDGKVIESLDNIDPNNISSISVIKDNSYDTLDLTAEQRKQAEEGGVIAVTSKDSSDESKSEKIADSGEVRVVGYGTKSKSSMDSALVVGYGKKMDINKDNSVVVVGYGTKKKSDMDSVVVVGRGRMNEINMHVATQKKGNYLIIVNNNVHNGEINDIDPNNIEYISVFKGDSDVDQTKEEARSAGVNKISYSSDELKENRINRAKELVPNISDSDLKKAEAGLIVIKLK